MRSSPSTPIPARATSSGFKVASEEGGTDSLGTLRNCLWDKYEAATGLTRHYVTITKNMTNYHAFREISLETPAAIIELGFLKADRELLDRTARTRGEGRRRTASSAFSLPPSPTGRRAHSADRSAK